MSCTCNFQPGDLVVLKGSPLDVVMAVGYVEQDDWGMVEQLGMAMQIKPFFKQVFVQWEPCMPKGALTYGFECCRLERVG